MEIVYKVETITTKEKKEIEINRFFILFENGNLLEIKPVSYKSKNGSWHSNEQTLLVIGRKLG